MENIAEQREAWIKELEAGATRSTRRPCARCVSNGSALNGYQSNEENQMTNQTVTQIAEAKPPSIEGNSRPWEYILLAIYLVIMALGMIVAIIAFWPVIPPEGAGQPAGQVTQFLFWRIDLQMELRLLVIVVLGGALGGLIHCLRSLIPVCGQ